MVFLNDAGEYAFSSVIARSDAPDGYNINARCGSTHPEALQELVVECAADAGFAFEQTIKEIDYLDPFEVKEEW